MEKIIILLLLVLTACMSSEVLNAPKAEDCDTAAISQTRSHCDTLGMPIGFGVRLEDWEEIKDNI